MLLAGRTSARLRRRVPERAWAPPTPVTITSSFFTLTKLRTPLVDPDRAECRRVPPSITPWSGAAGGARVADGLLLSRRRAATAPPGTGTVETSRYVGRHVMDFSRTRSLLENDPADDSDEATSIRPGTGRRSSCGSSTSDIARLAVQVPARAVRSRPRHHRATSLSSGPGADHLLVLDQRCLLTSFVPGSCWSQEMADLGAQLAPHSGRWYRRLVGVVADPAPPRPPRSSSRSPLRPPRVARLRGLRRRSRPASETPSPVSTVCQVSRSTRTRRMN